MKAFFIKDFFISTKVKHKGIEHLQGKGIIWSELYFKSFVTIFFLNLEIVATQGKELYEVMYWDTLNKLNSNFETISLSKTQPSLP